MSNFKNLEKVCEKGDFLRVNRQSRDSAYLLGKFENGGFCID
jgi:hypothetical protein